MEKTRIVITKEIFTIQEMSPVSQAPVAEADGVVGGVPQAQEILVDHREYAGGIYW